MAKSIIFLALALLAIANESLSQSLIDLGSVDGKSFYLDKIQFGNWTEAGNLCKRSNLTLASVESANQVDLIGQGLSDNLMRRAWTSARELRSHSSFAWNTTEDQPDRGLFLEWLHEDPSQVPYHYCATANEMSKKLYMATVECSFLLTGILCEGKEEKPSTVDFVPLFVPRQ